MLWVLGSVCLDFTYRPRQEHFSKLRPLFSIFSKRYVVLSCFKGSDQTASLWVYWSVESYTYSPHRAQLLAMAVANVTTSSAITSSSWWVPSASSPSTGSLVSPPFKGGRLALWSSCHSYCTALGALGKNNLLMFYWVQLVLVYVFSGRILVSVIPMKSVGISVLVD